jgi:hypothetical protein
MKKKKIIIIIGVFFLATLPGIAYDLGIIGGISSKPNKLTIGFSGSMRLIVPGLKMEFELFKKIESTTKILSGGIKFNPKIGKISLYGILGVGTEFEKLNFQFSEYRAFTFMGFGVHLYLMDMMSLRGDMRFYNFSDINRNQFSLGLFLHL